MCNTAKCAACRHSEKGYGLGDFVVDLVLAVGWLIRKSPKVIVPVAAFLGWVGWVWFTGRTWRHQVGRRWVRREVRATGNCLLVAVAGLLIWQPWITASLLAIAGAALGGTALTMRRRAVRRPLRVEATAGRPIRKELHHGR